MKRLVILTIAVVFSSCSYPQYTTKKIRNFRDQKPQIAIDDVKISPYHFSAGQRRGSLRVITDTLEIINDMEVVLRSSLQTKGVIADKLVNEDRLNMLIDPKLRWSNRKLKRFLEQQKLDKNTLLPILCYNVTLEPERTGGGGLEFVSRTGNDRYYIAHQVYIAYYNEDGMVYLRNVSRWDEKIVPSGTPITHEFPQEVLDTLMHLALEPLLRQMEKGR